jgi:hypothetical protein
MKKVISFVLIAAFLNFIVVPETFAKRSYHGDYDNIADKIEDENNDAQNTALIIAGVAVVVAAVVFLIVKSKKSGSSADATQNQNPTQSEVVMNNVDITPGGNLVVLKW